MRKALPGPSVFDPGRKRTPNEPRKSTRQAGYTTPATYTGNTQAAIDTGDEYLYNTITNTTQFNRGGTERKPPF